MENQHNQLYENKSEREREKPQQGQDALKYRLYQYMKIKLIIQIGFVIIPITEDFFTVQNNQQGLHAEVSLMYFQRDWTTGSGFAQPLHENTYCTFEMQLRWTQTTHRRL